jgi:hypothetical protein
MTSNKDKIKQDTPAKPVENTTNTRSDELQGEGNYEAARRYNEATREHARSGNVEREAREAKPKNADEARDLERAEQEGRSHASEEDPLLDDPEQIKHDPRDIA